jgi:carboxymethylenebutenolidase
MKGAVRMGDWNDYLVEVVGNRYITRLDGVTMVDLTDPKPSSSDGKIALQLHAGGHLFSWGGRIRCVRALMADLSARKGASFDDIDAVRQWLEGRQDCTGKTGVIGFCETGGFAILLAAGYGLSAAAANYGQVPNDIDAILDGACPVVASFGGRDRTLKGAAARLNAALELRQIEHDVKEYPDAGHSFLDDHKGFIGVLGVLMGVELQREGRG